MRTVYKIFYKSIKTNSINQIFSSHYLAICEDYATDQISTLFKHDIIPVVFGGANYSQLFPKKSYIDALSFESPQHLAKYLLEIGSNISLYNDYFEWKREYEVTDFGHEPNWSNFCDLCAKLADSSEPNSYLSSHYLYKWWLKDSKCRKYGVID
jgi:alpha-1,3-fucosyltransferase